MSDRPTLLLLYDIQESIQKIESYISGLNFSAFKNNTLVRDAVERNIEIIGEAVNKLPENYKQLNNHIEWHKPAGMRNRLIHGNFATDIPLLWNTVTNILPVFKKEIENLIKNLEC